MEITLLFIFIGLVVVSAILSYRDTLTSSEDAAETQNSPHTILFYALLPFPFVFGILSYIAYKSFNECKSLNEGSAYADLCPMINQFFTLPGLIIVIGLILFEFVQGYTIFKKDAQSLFEPKKIGIGLGIGLGIIGLICGGLIILP